MRPFLTSVIISSLVLAAQPTLTDSRIMALAETGVSEAEILRLVKTALEFDFDLRPVATEAMMKAGVSENVIKAMAARESGDTSTAAVEPGSQITRTANGSAQTNQPEHFLGTVMDTDLALHTITVREDKTRVLRKVFLGNTRTMFKIEPGAKDLTNAIRITADDVGTGDRVDVRGSIWQDDPNTISAQSMLLMKPMAARGSGTASTPVDPGSPVTRSLAPKRQGHVEGAVKISVVETMTSQKNFSLPIRGTPTTATTDCDSNYTHCSTTITPGSDPTRLDFSLGQVYVKAVLPNGQRIMLWCQAALRNCAKLEPGQYDADIKGKTVWLDVVYPNGMIVKIKYHIRSKGWQ